MITALGFCLAPLLGKAQALSMKEIQGYRSYLHNSLSLQGHKAFRKGLEKVRKLSLQQLQTQFLGAAQNEINAAHQRTWASILIDRDFQGKSLINSLLENTHYSERAEKFSSLIEFGAFQIGSEEDLSWSFLNLNFQSFAEFLVHKIKDDDPDILALMMSFLTHEQNISWTTEFSPYQKFKRQWVQRHHLDILESLFRHNHFDAAAFLIEQLPSYGIPYLQHFEDSDLNISIRCYAPVLESILSAMDMLYKEHSHSGSYELKERLVDVHIFDALSQDILESNPFSIDSEKNLDANLAKMKVYLEPSIINAYKSYIKLGNIRNHFLGIYSRFLQIELAANEQPKRFFYELIAYLHSENPAFGHLFSFDGFDYLFLNKGGNGENFLKVALNWFDIYMFSILIRDIPLESLEEEDNNLFHHLLNAGASTSSSSGLSDESNCLRLIRFILFSYQIDSQHIVRFLRKKNESGETPLYLAAHHGMFRVFYTLKKYLSDRAYYSEDEHAPPYFLDTILLRGIQHRLRTSPSIELENAGKHINDMLSKRNKENSCMSPYSDRNIVDARHQKAIIDKINYALAQPIPPKKDPAKYLYPNIFSLLVKHYFAANFWTGSFKDFSRAPASIQMSYLKKPLTIIINKIIFSCAKGRLQADDIMSILCGKKQNRISNILKEHILDLIKRLLIQDTRKVGQW